MTTEQTPPLVTVLMPAYNASGYIADAAQSVFAQGVDDLELLAIDDGSIDGCIDELMALGDSRIRVVAQANAGLVAALNRGLDEARGTFIARMDADDLLPEGRLRAQLSWMAEHPARIICGTDYELFEAATGYVRTPRIDKACRQRLLLGSCHCGASVMIRRSVIEETGIRFDPAFVHAEDYEFFTRLCAYGEIGNVPMLGYRYRIHAKSVSNRHAEVQRASHLLAASRYAESIGVTPLPDDVLTRLMWPSGSSRTGLVLGTAAAAARAWVRYRGADIARFGGRRVFEAAAAARSRD
ncbi:glycosyltransferase family A protein [Gordonia sp. (in: high G+C Gram-positive bacteria)]|uniref:glycosyltransferase family 2 protein n=1 Tax=Gordonia sp. (in: high G+C Gram-positive bacteria) TaxID=84139 RepID=UPI001D5E356F|nr:glycosyltransferase family A protein [Gordonia sp. (in: high G+C Gram-positive bacteria)]MCB1296079.1 glycosyltransferase family 2 protein [Gordonia sp. (in: high G+C Gram-positive bacteria)]HMS76236.1 glycosyltransferase family A protein [Gordonia sp. (in: high G+C Gram-positive bacteria)]